MTITLRQSDFKAFFEAPFKIYGRGSKFISQFDDEFKGLFSKKNPMVASNDLTITYWTAHSSDGEILGRITAHVHESSQKHFPVRTGFFGYFDCVDDIDVSRTLMDAASAWLREKGCKAISGNFNLMATQMMGVLEEGFDKQPYLAMNWSGPQMPGLLKKLGFERSFPMTTFEIDLSAVTDEMLLDQRQKENLSSQNFRWTHARKRTLKKELEEIRVVMNDAFEKNPFFAPLKADEFQFQAKDLSFILDPPITSLAYAPNGDLAGCIVAIPDVNTLMQSLDSRLKVKALWEIPKFKMTRDRALILFAATRRQNQATGLGWTLAAQCIRNLKARGYKSLGVTWVGDTNKASLALVNKVGGKPIHRLGLYGKAL